MRVVINVGRNDDGTPKLRVEVEESVGDTQRRVHVTDALGAGELAAMEAVVREARKAAEHKLAAAGMPPMRG